MLRDTTSTLARLLAPKSSKARLQASASTSKAHLLVSGAVVPVVNSSVCSLMFSDTLVPTGTFYTVSLVNRNGSIISGFPQTWCTYGGLSGTINVSNGAPTGNCGTNGVFYPTPLFSSQLNGALTQSVGGNLSVGGNESLGGNETVTGNISANGTLNAVGSATVGGEQVKVSGTACGQTLDLFNIDATPTNPHKYFRVNQATGALEILNSACSTVMLSIAETGSITAPSGGNNSSLVGFSNITGLPGLASLYINAGATTQSSPASGNFVVLTGGAPATTGTGGGIAINGAASCLGGTCTGYGYGPLSTNTVFGTYNGITLAGNGLPSEPSQIFVIAQAANYNGAGPFRSLAPTSLCP